MKIKESICGYLALCYHYIRPLNRIKRFPRIMGNTEEEFINHLENLKKEYEVFSPDEAYKFSFGKLNLCKKPGLLFTFDDGLFDHFLAAEILAENKIKGTFFIPTCILKDKLPANPIIIHYCLAIYGIKKFLVVYKKGLQEYNLKINDCELNFSNVKDDPWESITAIKSFFHYKLPRKVSRKILLFIYSKLMLPDFPDALEIMHLNHKQIASMLKMGHSIGTHSHTHISVASSRLTRNEFKEEIIMPKKYLEDKFNISVNSLSYPFGDEKDCLSAKSLIERTGDYKLAFTVKNVLNTRDISPLELGRYMPTSRDNATVLQNKLRDICSSSGKEI